MFPGPEPFNRKDRKELSVLSVALWFKSGFPGCVRVDCTNDSPLR
jgi:hypothetical protein